MIENKKLLKTFHDRGRCECCGRCLPTAPHHIYARGQGGGSRLDIPENLVALCMECHNLAQHKPRDPKYGMSAMWALAGRRLGKLGEECERFVRDHFIPEYRKKR